MDEIDNLIKQCCLPTGSEEIPLGSGILKGIIGSGGMAKVYKIWNSGFDVYRAVKILIPSNKSKIQERFDLEAKITAKLSHPNIIAVHNVGVWQGLPFIEMEYIDGNSLDKIIKVKGKLPLEVCCSIAIFIARGLVYAHNQTVTLYGRDYHGIIHRDLKPQNIMISNEGKVKIMDFGIARPIETGLHTTDSNIVGTTQYLSPEQIDGNEIDGRTDIYSCGAVLYEMITGERTFPQETMYHLFKQKLTGKYRKYEDFSIDVPKWISNISHKCLAVEKEKRYSSASELLDDLENVLSFLSDETPDIIVQEYVKDPLTYKSKRKKVEKKHLPKSALLISIVVVCIVAAVFLFDFMSKTNNTKVEVTSFDKSKIPNIENRITDHMKAPDPSIYTMEKEPVVKENHSAEVVVKKAPTPAPAPLVQKKTGRDILKEKYGSDDFSIIAKKAYEKRDYASVILSLDGKKENTLDEKIMLMEAYIETGKTDKAMDFMEVGSQDAYFYLLKGELFYKTNKLKDAAAALQEALTNESALRSNTEVQKDALYFSALVYDKMNENNPTSSSKAVSRKSWKLVEDVYSDNKDNTRYKEAVIKR